MSDNTIGAIIFAMILLVIIGLATGLFLAKSSRASDLECIHAGKCEVVEDRSGSLIVVQRR